MAEEALIAGKRALAGRLALHGLAEEDIFANNARRLFGESVPIRTYGERITRLAEIEVEPEMLEDYMAFAREVGQVSMTTEPGVLALFSMQAKDNPSKIYILEVYADNNAYQQHIRTAHFQKYKKSTEKMVRSLKLIDTTPMVKMGFVKYGK